jgi:hypothetical protein
MITIFSRCGGCGCNVVDPKVAHVYQPHDRRLERRVTHLCQRCSRIAAKNPRFRRKIQLRAEEAAHAHERN